MKHTPGPWKWRINRSTKRVYLNGHGKTVMDFVRYGMSCAAPRFINDENLMDRAEVYASNIPGYAHHSHWDQDIDHPDARLIAAAPDLLEAAKKVCEAYEEVPIRYRFAIMDELEAAIFKAEGKEGA